MSQEPTEELIGFKEDLDAALNKLPVYRGITYRSVSDFGILDVSAFLTGHIPGKKIQFPAYLSSGTEIYDPEFPIQYVIQGRTGRDLRGFNPNEFEILFPRGRTFLIQKSEGNTIYMEEVEDG